MDDRHMRHEHFVVNVEAFAKSKSTLPLFQAAYVTIPGPNIVVVTYDILHVPGVSNTKRHTDAAFPMWSLCKITTCLEICSTC